MKYIHYCESISDFNTKSKNIQDTEPWVSVTEGFEGVTYSPTLSVRSSPDACGFEYVDLGLPSGTLWSTMNIDSVNIEDLGSKFAWGELVSKEEFSASNYRWTYSTPEKYNLTDGLTELELEDDAANDGWGGGWHIPTKDQFSELINNTTISVEVTNGVSGWKFESSNGSYIFLPLGTGSYSGNYKYWTSTVSPYTSSSAKQSSWALRNTNTPSSPSSPTSSLNLIERYGGGWIRPVIEPGRFWYHKPVHKK